MRWVKTHCPLPLSTASYACVERPREVLGSAIGGGCRVSPLSFPALICQTAFHAMQRSVTMLILSSFQMRMVTSLLVPPPRCAWEEPGGGPQPPAQTWECWVAPWVPAFASVYPWMGSDPVSEKPSVAAVN